MLKTTPFHPRTAPLVQGNAWRRWSGYSVASAYELQHEREYAAIRSAAALIDVSPLCKYLVSGPDAARLLDRMVTRDVTKCRVGQVMYTPWCDARGKVIDDLAPGVAPGGVHHLAYPAFRDIPGHHPVEEARRIGTRDEVLAEGGDVDQRGRASDGGIFALVLQLVSARDTVPRPAPPRVALDEGSGAGMERGGLEHAGNKAERRSGGKAVSGVDSSSVRSVARRPGRRFHLTAFTPLFRPLRFFPGGPSPHRGLSILEDATRRPSGTRCHGHACRTPLGARGCGPGRPALADFHSHPARPAVQRSFPGHPRGTGLAGPPVQAAGRTALPVRCPQARERLRLQRAGEMGHVHVRSAPPPDRGGAGAARHGGSQGHGPADPGRPAVLREGRAGYSYRHLHRRREIRPRGE